MKQVAVVIPLYQLTLSNFERISLEQCFRIFSNREIFFLIPKPLEKQLLTHEITRGKKWGYKTFPDYFFVDTSAYNKLMKLPAFYQAFLAFEYLLIYQLDAFVFRDELDLWCRKNFDYIGAPFVNEAAKAHKDFFVGQGNGGFSLRKVSRFYQVVTSFKKLQFKHPFFSVAKPWYINLWRDIKYNWIYNFSLYPFQPVVNEDIFWAQLVPGKFSAFQVPTPAQALAFSFEVAPSRLYQLNGYHLPFGCHAWHRYEFDFWKTHIREAGYEI